MYVIPILHIGNVRFNYIGNIEDTFYVVWHFSKHMQCTYIVICMSLLSIVTDDVHANISCMDINIFISRIIDV